MDSMDSVDLSLMSLEEPRIICLDDTSDAKEEELATKSNVQGKEADE